MTAAPDLYGPIRRITNEEYLRMFELGVFNQDEKVELLEGVITQVSPQSPLHAEAIRRLNRYLSSAAGDAYQVGMQMPLVAADDSYPNQMPMFSETTLAVSAIPRLATWS